MKQQYKKWLYYATDPISFTRDILGYEVKDFHAAWLQFINKNRSTVLLAPRGHGKTTVHTIADIVWSLCHNPNLRIFILSKSSALAQRNLTEIKWHFTQNEKLIEMYGDLTNRDAKWASEEIMLRRAKNVPFKESTVTARGIESDIIGGHYEKIFCDDIIDEKNSTTANQRDKVRQLYERTIGPMLEPWSEIHFVGTRWHEFDIYGELIDSGLYKYKVYDMIVNEQKKQTLWPERFPYDSDDPDAITATSLKKKYGTVNFALNYRNDVSQFRNAIFKMDWMKYYVEPPPKMRKFMGVDLAISEKGDYFAIATIGVSDSGDIYVLDTYYGHHSFFPQLKKISVYASKHNVIKIGIESNAYQKALPEELKRRTEEFGLLPIFPITTTKDKITRARKVSALFESGRVFVKKLQQIELIDEILNFPRASVADDVLDALMIAIDVADIRPGVDFKEIGKLVHIGRYSRRII
jgi:predicted phage terminase large subunit-like protein